MDKPELDNNKKEKGRYGEEVAVRYLTEQGYEILKKNYRYGKGEIDIVAHKDEILVFVEVKYRSKEDDELPEDQVTPRKRAQVRHVAEGYLFEHDIHDTACRCDVVAITGKGDNVVLRHLKDAF